MKTTLIACMLLFAGVLCAQNKLTVVVDGIENVKGQLLVGVYDEASFLKKPTFSALGKVTGETVTVVVENIPNGTYAISLFQDEDENYQLNKGAYGIPTEKYAFSNNARNEMGPPAFADCKFQIEENSTIYITLQ